MLLGEMHGGEVGREAAVADVVGHHRHGRHLLIVEDDGWMRGVQGECRFTELLQHDSVRGEGEAAERRAANEAGRIGPEVDGGALHVDEDDTAEGEENGMRHVAEAGENQEHGRGGDDWRGVSGDDACRVAGCIAGGGCTWSDHRDVLVTFMPSRQTTYLPREKKMKTKKKQLKSKIRTFSMFLSPPKTPFW